MSVAKLFNFDDVVMVYLIRFNDYDEDMLEDTWHTYFLRRSDISDNFYPGINVGLPMWESYHSFDN